MPAVVAVEHFIPLLVALAGLAVVELAVALALTLIPDITANLEL
jgi:hypothetical protein